MSCNMTKNSGMPFQWIHSRNKKVLRCDQCNIIFYFEKDMIDHFVRNHENKIFHYVCSFCLRNFDSSDNLLDHFESQHIALYYSCSKCHQEFKSLTDLLPHTLLHKNSKQLTDSPSSQTIAVEKRYLSCSFCSKLFSLPSLLRSHTALHLGFYNCYKGHKVSAEKICLIDHFINFSCEKCDKNNQNYGCVENHSVSSTLRQAIDCISNSDSDAYKCDRASNDNDNYTTNTAVTCGECNSKFKSMKLLTRHLKNEHCIEVRIAEDENESDDTMDEINFSINKGFTSKYSSNFLCIFCLEHFENKNVLESHEKTHSEEIDPENKFQMSCDYCQKIFLGYNDYRKHVFSCLEKPQTLNGKKSSFMSLLKHFVDENTADCKEQTQMKGKAEVVNKNEIDWDETELAEIKDGDLKDITQALTKLESPNLEKHRKQTSKIPRNLMNERNDDTKYLNTKKTFALLRGKGDAKVYVCHFCEKSFRSKQKFLDHYFNHDNSVKPYGCPACDARLGYSTSVPKHIQMHLRDLGVVTIERKPHLCPKCGKDYRDRASLKRHEAMVHLKIGHLCLQCDRKFSSPHALKQHQHQHTGDFIYECDQCDKRYGNASSLYNHKKSHSQQKFICNICCKSFNLKHHLLRHLNTHTGFGPKSTKKIKKELPKAPVD